jgi:hypothetical protein
MVNDGIISKWEIEQYLKSIRNELEDEIYEQFLNYLNLKNTPETWNMIHSDIDKIKTLYDLTAESLEINGVNIILDNKDFIQIKNE